MSIMLFNPTNEKFEMQYAGRMLYLPAGEKLKVEDACGKHLLNAFSVRGLCSLEFGDDEQTVIAEGQRRNMEFKKQLVMRHNYRNVQRKQQGLAWTAPSATVKSYAAELNIALDEPYAEQGKSNDRVLALEAQVMELTRLLATFMSGGGMEVQVANKKEKSK